MLTRQIQHRFTCRCCSLSFWNDSGCFSVHALRRSDSWAASSPKGPKSWKLIKLWDKKEIQWGRLLAEHLPAMISAGNSLELLQPFNLWTSNPLLLPKRQISSPSGCCSIQCKRSTEWVMLTHYWDTMSCKFCQHKWHWGHASNKLHLASLQPVHYSFFLLRRSNWLFYGIHESLNGKLAQTHRQEWARWPHDMQCNELCITHGLQNLIWWDSVGHEWCTRTSSM